MVEKVWSLEFNGNILGVRALTKQNKYYDIDIDVYNKKLKLDPTTLPSLQLLEIRDMLMTKEEFESGVLIEDGSSNLELLKSVRTFIRLTMNRNPYYKAKHKERVRKLTQQFYRYMPTPWLPAFAEYHINNFEGFDNPYMSLTESQVNIIKKYFRWRSRMVFEEQGASNVLRTKFDKARELVALMGNADDWQYDGTVDTGFKGGGHCELGHSLRYEHYAHSPSLRKYIIFGQTCMSDFFEVDEKVLKRIIEAQEYLIKEIKVSIFIKEKGLYKEHQEEYPDVLNVVSHFKGRLVSSGADWISFIEEFTKNGLPLTRSMIDRYKPLLWKMQDDLDRARIKAKQEAERPSPFDRMSDITPKETLSGINTSVSIKDAVPLREVDEQTKAFRSKWGIKDFDNQQNSNLQVDYKRPRGLVEVWSDPRPEPSDRETDTVVSRMESKQSTDTSNGSFNGTLSPIVIEQMTTIEKAGKEDKISTRHFAFTVMETIRRTGRVSGKQQKFLDDALEKIRIFEEQPF